MPTEGLAHTMDAGLSVAARRSGRRLRRRVAQASGHEFYASVRTHGAIDAAEVVVVLIDGSEPITEQDQRVLSMVISTSI
jgi:predicted GTPase